jgi:acyl-CoA synthetase (AMP-forming)/AMP-acid ligase II
VVADGEVDGAALIAYCRGALAPYKVPKAVFFIDDLPKSAQGKVLKNDLVERLPAQD